MSSDSSKMAKRKETEKTGSTPTNKGPRTETENNDERTDASTQLNMSNDSTRSNTTVRTNLCYAEVLADTEKKLEQATLQ